jgi:hypothetical protein
VLDVVVHQNIRLSDVIVSDVLDSDHLPIIFRILELLDKFIDWDQFHSLASELIPPGI